MSLGLTIALVCVFLFFIGMFSVSALCKAAARPMPSIPISGAGSDAAGEVSAFSSHQSGTRLSDTPPLSSASVAPALDAERILHV